jgi:hypothetical protein
MSGICAAICTVVAVAQDIDRRWYWHILGVRLPNFTLLAGGAGFLPSSIWSHVFGLMLFPDGSDSK